MFSVICNTLYERQHDKTNKMGVRLAKTQMDIRPVWSIFAVRMTKPWVLSYTLSAQSDQSLRWAHTHLVDFVVSWLIFRFQPEPDLHPQ